MEVQRIQGTRRGADGRVGYLQITRCGFQVGMTKQDLDVAQIDTRFQQVRGEGVRDYT